MPSPYPLAFDREMGCTDAELRAWLPGACGQRELTWREHGVDIELVGGQVRIDWQTLVPRRIALMVMPRLAVRFTALQVDTEDWQRFMRYFDLYTQRGGG
jgi:hypothetical protein